MPNSDLDAVNPNLEKGSTSHFVKATKPVQTAGGKLALKWTSCLEQYKCAVKEEV